jgi:hypothetical protein
MERRNTCASCRYWDSDFGPDTTENGACLRYPPVVQSGNRAVWPLTVLDDWCGEFSAAEFDLDGATHYPPVSSENHDHYKEITSICVKCGESVHRILGTVMCVNCGWKPGGDSSST